MKKIASLDRDCPYIFDPKFIKIIANYQDALLKLLGPERYFKIGKK